MNGISTPLLLLRKFFLSFKESQPVSSLDYSLKKFGYFSKEAIAVVDIQPGEEGQVAYAGTFWIGRYVSGDQLIHKGQKIYVQGLENIWLNISAIDHSS